MTVDVTVDASDGQVIVGVDAEDLSALASVETDNVDEEIVDEVVETLRSELEHSTAVADIFAEPEGSS